MGKPIALSSVVHAFFSFTTTFLLFLLSLGPIPQHVGFVMDGNRRYAKELGQKVEQGHREGFVALRRTLEICLRLRIRAVSIYAFSIDNFNRSDGEVNALMKLAKNRLSELCKHGDLLEEYGIKIKFTGNLSMLPLDVLQAVEEMEAMTANNKNGVLNVCCPYTSRDEISSAIQETIASVYDGQTTLGEITSENVFSRLGTSKAVDAVDKRLFLNSEDPRKLDILVRTSGVKRLSDYMLWQASDDTQLHFVDTYWPDFGLSDMVPILLGWQQKVWTRRLGW
ncbi:di-trans,poly-cis-decaprenylcistransferase [Cryptococcus depauperatus CBS 7841]|uniref:Alkyl transferase n=1 Tax=Cryptococcus depauperatus CBS 7841 TaxID=1295531 RepID=A0A1E3IZV9_9TREE|nr:di-trans,poly-cis-decaprenylcistransferase [Cryptococcus depauperatus CBS 7841]ODN99849.1 di-trans,poly-cis-decaprenylcistransferase [Cryptococcus depauperatus CBS 7855]